jgi:glutamine synthetase
MLRVPEGGRFENRGVDGSANPYLAFTVMLAAGLDGVDHGKDPGDPLDENLYTADPADLAARGIRAMPATLAHAVDELVGDDVLRRALGTVRDGDYVDYFAQVKREEFRAYHAVVSGWEVQRYLTLF